MRAAGRSWNPEDDAPGAPASLPASFEEACLASKDARAHRRAVNPPLAILGVPFDNVTIATGSCYRSFIRSLHGQLRFGSDGADKKLAQHHGTKLVFRHVQPAVQNV